MPEIKFKKPNYDTLTPSGVERVTGKLLSYLNDTNPDASEFVHYLLTDRHSEVQSKADTSKLEALDAKILEVLKKIEANMIDEQDTSIKYKDRASNITTAVWTGEDFEETGDSSETSSDGSFFMRRPRTLAERRKRLEEKRRKKEERRKQREEKKRRKEEQRRKKEEPKQNKEEPKNRQPKEEPRTRASEVQTENKKGRIASDAKPHGQPKGMGRLGKMGRLFEGMGRLAKAGRVPLRLLGSAYGATFYPIVATALGIYDGIQGFRNASENLNIKENELTTTNKLSSAAGGVLSGLTLGIVDADYMAKAVNNGIGGNADLKRFETAGLIKHVALGDSKITNWDAIEKLSKDDIARIINIDDWSEEDAARLNELYGKAPEKASEDAEAEAKFRIADQVQHIDKNKTVIELDNLGVINQSLIGDSKIVDWDTVVTLPEANVDRLIEFDDWDELTLQRLKSIKSIAADVDSFKKELPNLTRNEQLQATEKKLNDLISLKSKFNDTRDDAKKQTIDDSIRAFTNVLSAIKNNRIEAKDQRYEPLSVAEINAASVSLQNLDLQPGVYSTLTEEFPMGDLTIGVAPGEKLPPMDLKPSNATFSANDEVGVLSEKYETGGRGVGTISSGKDDPGGISYGPWQLSSKKETLSAYLESEEAGQYGRQFRGLKINSPEFQRRWKEVSEADPGGFAKSQHDFLLRQNVNPVMSYAASKGIDTSSKTIQNVLWSQAIQHGLRGNKEIIDLAVKKGNPKDVPSMIDALYSARSTYVAKLSSLRANVKESLLNRYRSEGSDALAMWAQESRGSKKSDQVSVKEAGTSEPVEPTVTNKVAEANSVNSYTHNITNTSVSTSDAILKAATVAGAAAGLRAVNAQQEKVDSEHSAPVFTRFPITQDGRK